MSRLGQIFIVTLVGCATLLRPVAIAADPLQESESVARDGPHDVPPARGGQVREATIALGAQTVHTLCTGGPTRVVLLPGGPAGASSWRGVLERLAGEVGACAYDRPEPFDGSTARGWYELMDEMRRIHSALAIDAPYTVVGQGVGGLYARLFAADRPDDVAGLVLLDPAHEDLPEAMRIGMPEPAWRKWRDRRYRPNADGVREVEVAERARRGRLPDIPVSVITAMRRPTGDGWSARFLTQAARRVHASIVRGVRLSRHVPAQNSGSLVQRDAPDLAAAEILRVARLASRVRR